MPAVKITQKPIGIPGDDTHFLVTQPELPEGYTPTGQETEEELAELKVESVREIEMDDMVELIQDKLDMDVTPTTGSSKPVTSGGIKTALDAADAEIGELKENINDKYDRYVSQSISGLSLDMFDICPTQYGIIQYESTDALTHSTLAATGITYLRSKFKSEYEDVSFRIHYGAFTPSPAIVFALAVNNDASIGFAINSTSGNTNKYTNTGFTTLSGIIRNANCRNVVVDDKLHFVKDGTKVALYLVDDGIDVPIFADEWVDVVSTYPNAGFAAEDVCFGFITSNSARNEVLIYDFSYNKTSGDHFMAYDEVDARLTALEDGGGYNPKKVDLFLFMGQSNMAGRGTGSQAPTVIENAGYEFRAVSDPTKLYPITEPFGVDENNSNGINDKFGTSNAKSGDMIPAFVNNYFKHTHTTIVGVSASEGGTHIGTWLPTPIQQTNAQRYADALNRWNSAISWLTDNGYTIRHKYILWCQGESDGDNSLTAEEYKSRFTTLWDAWKANGAEKIFVVKIGNYNGSDTSIDYNTIMTAQNEICQTMEDVVMVSTDFASMKDRSLMADAFHYKQAAYNEVGAYAGINTALYVNTDKEPTMYDTQNGTLYFSHKN